MAAFYTDDTGPGLTPPEALAEAIAAIGAPGFVPRAVDYLRAVAPFRGCLLLMLEDGRPPMRVYDNVREDRRDAVIGRYLEGAYLLDPFYVAFRAGRAPAFLHLSEVAPDRFAQSTYCREYYHSIRLQDEAAFLIDLPERRHLFYSIGRLADQPRFTAADLRALRAALSVFAALNRRHFTPAAQQSRRGAGAGTGIDGALSEFGAGLLTDREREIAILVLKGHSSKSVARMAGISPGTVKIHRKNIYRKLGISSQSELFALFLGALSRQSAA
ncbi:helix-turn-helix transcriptional regulator [Maritimibacter sp. 55A14]|uniref:helix-turn-helix transcriptional regulator n=1 Tax=Maritimibacter sp. 55A14 TaxID=2174844 RepID=UPI000D603EED|nr:helix-turn-helix transcriptional regulator [Maritimibacter sp. 55A14]PWE34365.1 helix-turn-helix transcriptional regulator [Maritimibacter sp. 55A14]